VCAREHNRTVLDVYGYKGGPCVRIDIKFIFKVLVEDTMPEFYPYKLLSGVYDLISKENKFAHVGSKKYTWHKQIINSHEMIGTACSSVDCLNSGDRSSFVVCRIDDLEPMFDEYVEDGDDLKIHDEIHCAILLCISCSKKSKSLGEVEIEDTPCIIDLDD